MAKRVLKRQAGLNATFYDDRLNACTSIFSKGSLSLLLVLYVLLDAVVHY